MAHLEETSNSDMTDPEAYTTLPQHPKFFNYTPKSEQPQEFMHRMLMRQTEAARRDKARQEWHAVHVFRKFRATEREDERKAAIAELNPNIDRRPARIGVVNDSRLTITLFMPEGQGHVLRQFRYQGPVDWSSRKFIVDVNRWRGAIFNQCLPPTYRRGTRFHEEEDQWLRDNLIGTKVADGGWPDVVARFNSHFEGRVLAGQTTPRPGRKRTQLASRRQWLINEGGGVRR